MKYNLFAIKKVEFEHQTEDPFRFDAYTEDLSNTYIPFSSVIRKPIYLFFVAYINYLIDKKLLNLTSKVKRREVQLRLEKLLVICWKHKDAIRGKSIIGSSIRNVNPFIGSYGNWVIQNCFRLYNSSSKIIISQKMIDNYLRYNDKEIKLINEFLNYSGSLDKNKTYLNNLIKKLCKKRSSFYNNPTLSKKYRTMFLKELRLVMLKNEYGDDKKLLNELFRRPSKSDTLTEKLLRLKKYPFRELNDWFRHFILAVDSDLQGQNSTNLWVKTDNYYKEIKKRRLKIRILEMRPEAKCWFELKGNFYKKTDDFSSSGWEALLRRARNIDGNYYDFRHRALASLLKESSSNAK